MTHVRVPAGYESVRAFPNPGGAEFDRNSPLKVGSRPAGRLQQRVPGHGLNRLDGRLRTSTGMGRNCWLP